MFSEKDVEKLKEAEKKQESGGCLTEVGSLFSVLVLIVIGLSLALSIISTSPEPGLAVAVTTTPIPVIDTPTLKPTATVTAVQVAEREGTATATPSAVPSHTPAATYTPLPTYTAVPSPTPMATYTPLPTYTAVAPTAIPTDTPTPAWAPLTEVILVQLDPPAPDRLSLSGLLIPGLSGLVLIAAGVLTALLFPRRRDKPAPAPQPSVVRMPQPIIINQPPAPHPAPTSDVTEQPDRPESGLTRVNPGVNSKNNGKIIIIMVGEGGEHLGQALLPFDKNREPTSSEKEFIRDLYRHVGNQTQVIYDCFRTKTDMTHDWVKRAIVETAVESEGT